MTAQQRRHVVVLGLSSLVLALSAIPAFASISYSVLGSNYTENFDTLPNSPTNTSLQSTVPWTDDATSTGSTTSLPGWYLYHQTTQSEGGTNGHQRLRNGSGNSGTGSFYSFGPNGNTDRALGDVTSSTIDTSYIALRLTNNTGVTLGQFTLTYTGEQWRDGGAATPNAQTMSFGYAVTSTAPTNISALSVTSVGALDFTSPTFTNTGSGAALDGNNALNRSLRSTTVGGFVWNPGEDLWLRWTDIDHGGNDHGLSLDDLSFSAAAPIEVNSVASGLSSAASTWSDNQSAGIGKGYHVVNGHTVTLDAPFLGSKLSIENGTLDISAGGSGQFFGAVTVEPNGNLTESVVGDVAIGDGASSGLKLNRDVAFNLDANSSFRLNAALTGTGNLSFNEATPGGANNAQVYLDAANGHSGTIRFNAGKQVNVTQQVGLANIEMNSTQSGGNILSFDPKATATINKVTFNAPGTLVHAVSTTTLTTGIRLQNITNLTANAAVNVDMSQTFAREERRFLVTNFQGSGNVTVVGTASDPTDPNSGGTSPNFTGITMNEFEVGAQGTDPGANTAETYSGTLSTQDYINVEVRRNLPAAKIVVNDKGRLETGAQPVPLPQNLGTNIGAVMVNAGGVFEVGFEQANAQAGAFIEGHHVNHVTLTTAAGRDGSLTLTGGANPSTLRLQINGTDKTTQYDFIDAQGNVNLAGKLDVLVNPVSCTGNDPCGANTNPTWSPVLGETFDIINLVSGPVAGDYDNSGTVNTDDYNTWRAAFGSTVAAGTGADGNRNGTIDAADFVVWRNNLNASSTIGSIIGTFDTINIVDPSGALSGLTLQAVYTSTAVKLQVVAAAGVGQSTAIPEPAAVNVIVLGVLAFVGRRRRRISADV